MKRSALTTYESLSQFVEKILHWIDLIKYKKLSKWNSRLCGLAPFYSRGDSDFSVGMRRRIKKGSYSFPSPEWDQISEEGNPFFLCICQT